MFCYSCGANVVDGAKFCVKCGAKVVDAATLETPAQKPAQNSTQNQNRSVNQNSQHKGANANRQRQPRAEQKSIQFDLQRCRTAAEATAEINQWLSQQCIIIDKAYYRTFVPPFVGREWTTVITYCEITYHEDPRGKKYFVQTYAAQAKVKYHFFSSEITKTALEAVEELEQAALANHPSVTRERNYDRMVVMEGSIQVQTRVGLYSMP